MSWLTKITGIDKVVNKMVDNKMNSLGYLISGDSLLTNPRLIEFRMREYRVWASSNPNNLLMFYKMNPEPIPFNSNRLLFWKWVDGVNVPKLHYPAPEGLLNHMKSLIFGGDLDIQASYKGSKVTELDDARKQQLNSLNERLKDLLNDTNIEEMLQSAEVMASYSGNVAFKFVIDKAVHDKPIIQSYPRERHEVITKYGKTMEIVFDDEYKQNKETYILKSHYGKGYIKYRLVNSKGKEVPLDTINELSGLEDVTFNKPILMAVAKKNKATSNEFPDTPYGGSDFEGVTDIFHQIDEVFSTLALYIRRTRAQQWIDESILPVTNDGSRSYVPKEHEFDTVKMSPNIDNKQKYIRDNPEVKTEGHWSTIKELLKVVYQTVGMSYTTVGLDGVGANISGDALERREKSTIIIRDAKIKTYIPAIASICQLLLVYEDILKYGNIVSLYDEFEFITTFPDYNGQSYAEKVDELAKALNVGLIDVQEAINRLYGDEYTTNEKAILVRNVKIENGIPIFESQMVDQADDAVNNNSESET